jgi:flagellar basal body-associated protein FliL
MSGDASGWLWIVIDVVMVAILAAGLIYGMAKWRRWKQNPTQAAEREQKTRELFRNNPETR